MRDISRLLHRWWHPIGTALVRFFVVLIADYSWSGYAVVRASSRCGVRDWGGCMTSYRWSSCGRVVGLKCSVKYFNMADLDMAVCPHVTRSSENSSSLNSDANISLSWEKGVRAPVPAGPGFCVMSEAQGGLIPAVNYCTEDQREEIEFVGGSKCVTR